MTIQVELDSEIEAQLRAEAKERGLALEGYAQRLLLEAIESRPKRSPRGTPEDFQSFLDALASKAPNVTHLRLQPFSREMIYDEHD